MINTKPCSKCGMVLNVSQFRKGSTYKGKVYLTSWCKECANAYAKSRYVKRIRQKNPTAKQPPKKEKTEAEKVEWKRRVHEYYLAKIARNPSPSMRLKAQGLKHCNGCNKDLPLAQFKSCRCVECAKSYARDQYYKKRSLNPELMKAQSRVRSKRRSLIKRDEIKAWTKRYHQLNPHVHKAAKARRKARLYSAAVGNVLLIAKWEKSWKSKRTVICFWCGNRFNPKACHTDHISPISKGGPHAVENLCISCAPCNLSKQAKTVSEWNAEIAQPVLI